MVELSDRNIVKVCGVTRINDAVAVMEAGADMIGLNFAPTSKRITNAASAKGIVDAVSDSIVTVGVFTESPVDSICRIADAAGIRWVQLHFEASEDLARTFACRGFKVIRVFGWDGEATATQVEAFQKNVASDGGPAVDWLLLDSQRQGTSGGTGTVWNWAEADAVRFDRPWLLAGGLNSDNVAEGIRIARPQGVDVAGGVESAPGIKDHQKILTFVANAKAAFMMNAAGG